MKNNKFIQVEFLQIRADTQLKEGRRKTVGSNSFIHALSTFYSEIGPVCEKFDVACSYLEVSAPGFKVKSDYKVTYALLRVILIFSIISGLWMQEHCGINSKFEIYTGR